MEDVSVPMATHILLLPLPEIFDDTTCTCRRSRETIKTDFLVNDKANGVIRVKKVNEMF